MTWSRLTEDGAWLVQVHDGQGDLIDVGAAADPVDAILGVVERLLSPARLAPDVGQDRRVSGCSRATLERIDHDGSRAGYFPYAVGSSEGRRK